MKRLFVAFVVASLGVVSSASASSLVFNGTTLTGVLGVDVGGTLYDVTFIEGLCADVFSGCDDPAIDFDFTDEVDAIFAGSKLLLEYNTLAPETGFGCADVNLCMALIPYGLAPGQVLTMAAKNQSNNFFDGPEALPLTLGVDTANGVNSAVMVWADFTPAAAVPEPATLALVTLGLAGIGARRWRRRAH